MRSVVARVIPLCLLLVCARVAGAQTTSADTLPVRIDSAAAAPAPAPAPVAAPDSTAPVLTDSAAVPDSAALTLPVDSQAVPASALRPAPSGAGALAPGDVVRLQSGAGHYSGRLTRVTDDTLVVVAPGRSDAVVRSDISELYRLAARSSRGRAMVRGAGVGFVGGAALGLLAGLAAGDVHCDGSDPTCQPGHDRTIGVALTVEGALIGSLLGVMIGPALRHTNWERIDAATPGPTAAAPSLSVHPHPGGGVSVGATLRL